MGKLRVEHDVGHRAIGKWFSPDYLFFGYRILAISSSVLHAVELSLDDGKNAEKHCCVLSFKKKK
jgi:hypothetical protein